MKLGRLVMIGSGVLLVSSCATKEIRGNTTFESFSTARKHVYTMHASNPTTFYCECRYVQRKIQLETCGYRPERKSVRAGRVEIEHIVPAAHFGGELRAWSRGDRDCREGDGTVFKGRNCARKVSATYRRMETDLYNLRPVVGEINQARRDYLMGEVPGEVRRFGRCDVEIVDQTMEPRPRIRGDIARTWFYMEWAYPAHVKLTPWQRTLYTEWSEADPVEGVERAWATEVARIQGNSNPFIR
jgi:deoxyribonuclease-1